MAKKPVLSVTESVTLAIRMTKRAAAESIWRRENNLHDDIRLTTPQHLEEIARIGRELDIRRIDVLSIVLSPRGGRVIVVKLALARTVNDLDPDRDAAIGICFVQKYDVWVPQTVEFHFRSWEKEKRSFEIHFGDDFELLSPL